MQNYIQKLTNHLSAEVHGRNALKLFTILVYGWFLLNALSFWPVKDLVWGPDKVFFRHGFPDGVLNNFIYQLVYQSTRAPFVYYLHIAMAAVSMPEFRWSFIPRLLTWITGWMLFYSATEAFNSGMMIMLLMAFYCAFVYTRSNNYYNIVTCNIMRYAAIIRICIVYVVAGIYKLSGQQWIAGDAFYYALQIDQYSSPYWQKANVIDFPGLYTTLNYIGLFYQLFFPIAIFLKRIRVFFLILGVTFHLFIGIFMHLWDFAVAMIFCYALFMNEKNISSLRRLFSRLSLAGLKMKK